MHVVSNRVGSSPLIRHFFSFFGFTVLQGACGLYCVMHKFRHATFLLARSLCVRQSSRSRSRAQQYSLSWQSEPRPQAKVCERRLDTSFGSGLIGLVTLHGGNQR